MPKLNRGFRKQGQHCRLWFASCPIGNPYPPSRTVETLSSEQQQQQQLLMVMLISRHTSPPYSLLSCGSGVHRTRANAQVLMQKRCDVLHWLTLEALLLNRSLKPRPLTAFLTAVWQVPSFRPLGDSSGLDSRKCCEDLCTHPSS